MAKKLHGVNLGGWLVLEKWLTPSLFLRTGAQDEYSFMNDPNAKKIINKHRRHFITDQDFKWLHDNGVDLVRIPVGYWLFKAIDGYTPTVSYLDQAMKWAEMYGLKVLIDLHAARGSQNGFDNSGRAGEIGWFTSNEYQENSLDVLERIAEKYKDSPALWGIELLNEPVSKGHYRKLLNFYRLAYDRLRGILPAGIHIIFHDSFRPLLFTGALKQRKSHPIMMDVHWYAMPFKTSNLDTYLRYSSRVRKMSLGFLRLWQPVMVGEWSTVLPQRFFDVREQSEHMELLRRNAAMQQNAHGKASAEIYWNYKAEGDGMWNYRDLKDKGIIN
jgi:glucan 1,3-beta-glucosidase